MSEIDLRDIMEYDGFYCALYQNKVMLKIYREGMDLNEFIEINKGHLGFIRENAEKRYGFRFQKKNIIGATIRFLQGMQVLDCKGYITKESRTFIQWHLMQG